LIAATSSGAGLVARRRNAPLAGFIAALGVAVLALSGCASSTTDATLARSSPAAADASSPDASYGGLPSFLPTPVVMPDSVLTATPDHPALTTEGDSVSVRVAQASALATITGPEVPGAGLPYQAEATTCTWTVTLSTTSGRLPIAVADFTSRDHLGKVYRPTLVPGQPPPPAELDPGHTTTFELRAVMPTGEGLINWAPVHGPIVASWDFEVEND
jgi:hypothetical protein